MCNFGQRSVCPSRLFVQGSFVGPGKYTHEVTLPRGTSALKALVYHYPEAALLLEP